MSIWIRLLIICVLSLLITLLLKVLVITDALYFNSLAEKLSYEQIEILLDKGKKWEWLAYVLVPVVYMFRCSLVALCLSLGLFLVNNHFQFGKVFKVAVSAEFVFLIPSLIKLFWFLFIQSNYTLEDIQTFSPLSALNLFDYHALEPWLLYPLQVFNVFEVLYWGILAYVLSKEYSDLDINRSMAIVLSCYGTGLVIWIAFVMFLTLTYT